MPTVIRKFFMFCMLVVVTISLGMVGISSPANASSTTSTAQSDDCDPGPCLGPPPTNGPLIAPPTVRKTHRPGYLRACEQPRKVVDKKGRRGGWTRVEYGKRGNAHPDGTTHMRAGHCSTFRVHRHRIFWISYNRKGQVTGSGYVRHIRLHCGR